MAEVCVLITVYNGAPWIAEALDSALAQQGVEPEILVIDDGSTDSTPEVLARYSAAHPGRVRVVRIPHAGLSRARNVGFDHARSEFVTALDADDRMHPLRVRLECDGLRAHPDAVLSFSGRWNFVDGSDVGRWGFTPQAFGVPPGEAFTLLADPISAMLRAGEYPGTDACTCRADWARTRGRFDESYSTFVDGERWLRCLRDTPVVYVAAPLYERRLHPAAMSSVAGSVESAVFSAMDAARAEWSRFNPEQRALISRFEKESGTWFARRAALAGSPASGLAFLFRHARRLHSPQWWRTLFYLLTPSFVHAARRRSGPFEPAADRPGVPRSVVSGADPLAVWVRPARMRPEDASGGRGDAPFSGVAPP